MKRFFLLLLSSLLLSSAWAENSYDNLQVSILTVKPRPNEIYTIYGHTALRLYDPENHIDTVLNWGTFNFNAPGFLFRFLKGETDYYLSTSPYNYFIYSYSTAEATVEEQILTIPSEKKAELIAYLNHNLEPENREYRYNFLFDNCTTRPRDIIEQFCGGKLIYPENDKEETFRDLIHYCTNPYPWMTFGIDLLIGEEADKTIDHRDKLFLPENLMNALNQASISIETGEKTTIVSASQTVIQSPKTKKTDSFFWNNPLCINFLIFIFYLLMIVFGYRKKKNIQVPLAMLFLTAGLAGCIISFVSFFSSHPCTNPNWNLLWLHPLHLIAFTGCFFKKSYPLIYWYHWSNLLLLSILLLAWFWIPQQLNVANIPLILCLWVSSGYSILQIKKSKK